MREILFKGKRIDNGEWVDGTNFYIAKNKVESFIENVQIDTETVGQYTGLTDKNGKKIFEGDIVKFEDNQYEVRRECDTPGGYWAETGYILDHIGWNDYIRFTDTIDGYNNEICVEVIGNIHDNPELLRKEDEGK